MEGRGGRERGGEKKEGVLVEEKWKKDLPQGPHIPLVNYNSLSSGAYVNSLPFSLPSPTPPFFLHLAPFPLFPPVLTPLRRLSITILLVCRGPDWVLFPLLYEKWAHITRDSWQGWHCSAAEPGQTGNKVLVCWKLKDVIGKERMRDACMYLSWLR